MVVVDADCKIVPDRIAGESDNLYVASLNIWTQVHKPLNHPILLLILLFFEFYEDGE